MLSLHVCCNDPDNGLFNGRAAMLNIIGANRELECELEPRSYFRAPRFAVMRDRIRLSGKHWPICGGKDYVGNWCWNSYIISDGRKTANWWMTEFLTWLRAKQNFRMNMGPCDLFEWFNTPAATVAPYIVHRWLGEIDGTPNQ